MANFFTKFLKIPGRNPILKTLFSIVNQHELQGRDDYLNLQQLRIKSRELYRSNAIARNIIDTLLEGIIGEGITLLSNVDREMIGLKNDEHVLINKRLETTFEMWGEDCGIKGESFYEITKLVLRTLLIDGEVFFHFPIIDGKKKIQIIEALEVEGLDYHENTGDVKAYKLFNRKTSIKKHTEHAGEKKQTFFHLFTPLREGQERGLPFLSPVINEIKVLGDYQRFELVKAKNNAGVFLKLIKKLSEGYEEESTNQNDKSDFASKIQLDGGTVIETPEGYDLNFHKSDQPNTNYKEFFTLTLKVISSALQIPLSFIVKEHTKSYSAARMEKEVAEKVFKSHLALFKKQFLNKVYADVISYFYQMNELKLEGFDLALGRYGYLKCDWVNKGIPHIDPYKESRAIALSLATGQTTFKELLKGKDVKEHFEQLQGEEEMRKELGINQVLGFNEKEEEKEEMTDD